MFQYKEETYMITSNIDEQYFFSLLKFDLSHIHSNYVIEKYINIYSYSDYFEDYYLKLKEFHIRDILVFDTPKVTTPGGDPYVHNIIISCFNNGLMFFQAQNLHNDSDTNKFTLSYIYKLEGIGKIFTDQQYNVNNDSLTLFVSTFSPPNVYEV